jgi:hypothetical protein
MNQVVGGDGVMSERQRRGQKDSDETSGHRSSQHQLFD